MTEIRFDTKIVVILRDDLPIWQKLNVAAFTVSGVANDPEVIGEPYQDGSGNRYLPMFRQPVLVFAAAGDRLRQAYDRAMALDVRLSIFTADLFRTGNDRDNRAAVHAVAAADLDLVGLAFRDSRKVADKVTKGLALHP